MNDDLSMRHPRLPLLARLIYRAGLAERLARLEGHVERLAQYEAHGSCPCKVWAVLPEGHSGLCGWPVDDHADSCPYWQAKFGDGDARCSEAKAFNSDLIN